MIFPWNTGSQSSTSTGNRFSIQIHFFAHHPKNSNRDSSVLYFCTPLTLTKLQRAKDEVTETQAADSQQHLWEMGTKEEDRMCFSFSFPSFQLQLQEELDWTEIRQSPCNGFITTLKCWDPAGPCPAPDTDLVKYKLLKMSSTWDGNCNKHVNWMRTEFVNRRKVWSIKKSLCPST